MLLEETFSPFLQQSLISNKSSVQLNFLKLFFHIRPQQTGHLNYYWWTCTCPVPCRDPPSSVVSWELQYTNNHLLFHYSPPAPHCPYHSPPPVGLFPRFPRRPFPWPCCCCCCWFFCGCLCPPFCSLCCNPDFFIFFTAPMSLLTP